MRPVPGARALAWLEAGHLAQAADAFNPALTIAANALRVAAASDLVR